MKFLKNISLTLFLSSSILYGQIPYEVVIPSITNAWRITIVEETNTMYVSTYNGLKEVDLQNIQNPPVNRGDLNSYILSAGDADYLYFISGFDPVINPDHRLLKADPNETIINYETFALFPGISGNSIYSVPFVDEFHFYFDYGGILHRKRLNSNEPIQKYVRGNANSPCDVLSMAKNNGRIYVGEIGCTGNIPDIYSIDINDADPQYTLFLEDIGRVFSMQYRFGYLYFIREYWNGSELSNVISRVPVDNPSLATVEDLSEQFSGNQVKQMRIYDGTIFFVNDTGNIYKLSETLSILDRNPHTNISMYPNPTNETISISGIQEESDFQIYTMTGVKILTGKVKPNEPITINNLASGMYFVRVAGITQPLKFVKE